MIDNTPTAGSSEVQLVRPVINVCHIRLLPLLQAVGVHCRLPGLLQGGIQVCYAC